MVTLEHPATKLRQLYCYYYYEVADQLTEGNSPNSNLYITGSLIITVK